MKQIVNFCIVGLILLGGRFAATSAEFSTAQQVKSAVVFTTPITFVGDVEPPQDESTALLAAIEEFHNHGVQVGFQALEGFVTQYQGSAWTPSIQVNLAERARQIGRYTMALQHWEAVWSASKDRSDADSREIAARAVAGWASLLSSLGRTKQLDMLFVEIKARGLDRGRYANALQSSEVGLATMRSTPGISFRCGSYSLARVIREIQPTNEVSQQIHELPSPDGGFKLSVLANIAATNHINAIAAYRDFGGEIPVPAVVHWRLDHYAAILKRQGEFYLVRDPTFGGEKWIASDIINAEASGNFLIVGTRLPTGFRVLSTEQAALVHGKGCCNNPNDLDDDTGDDDGDDCPPPPPPTPGDGPGAGDGEPCPDASEEAPEEAGMPRWRVSEPYISLWLHDTPLFYRQSSGSPFSLKVSYNHRGAIGKGPNVSGFGDRWECNWLGMLEDSGPVGGNPVSYVTNRLAGGGLAAFPVNGDQEPRSGRVLSGANAVGITGGLARIVSSYSKTNTYGFRFPYAGGPTRYFLTNRSDQFGRSITYGYVSNYVNARPVIRLTTVTDLDGKQSSLEYTNQAFPNLVTAVQDPYLRKARFFYDHLGRLTNITDMAGMPSSFQYDQDGSITNLQTPYGPTKFRYFSGTNSLAALNRAVEVTEPSGDKQLYAYHDWSPDGIGIFQTSEGCCLTQFRNSFHWNRQQYAALTQSGRTNVIEMPVEDYRKASIKHWLHGENVGEVVGVMSGQAGPVDVNSEKRVNNVTYSYVGQGSFNNAFMIGSHKLTAITRPDSSDQTDIIRNAWGRPTQFIYYRNGAHVVYSNEFNADGRTLLRVWGPRGEQVRGYRYHPANPNVLTSVTNAMGEVVSYGYDNAWRVVSVTNATGLVTTNGYYTSGLYVGFLQTRVDIGIRTNAYSYTNGNIFTHANELGLTVTNVWDDLNRLIRRAFSDGTTISNLYDPVRKLDRIAYKDRLNQWTYFGYNNLRQVTALTNANDQVTLYDYCNCGSLSQITRFDGGVPFITAYRYDLAGRRTNVTYADGYSQSFTYAPGWPGKWNGALISDPTGLTTRLDYGDYGQLASVGLASSPSAPMEVYLKRCTFDEYGRLATIVDRNGVATTNGYDLIGRITNRVIIDINGNPRSTNVFTYTANGLTNSTDELGYKTWYVYDAAGRLLRQTNANNELLQFSYDAADNLLTLMDARGQATRWNYDVFGRATNKVDAATNVVFVYQYDPLGRLTNRWSAAKGNTVYKYDGVGNLTNVVYASGTTSNLVLRYDGLNRLIRMLDGVGTTTFGWTSVGQLANEDGPWGQDTVSYMYTDHRRAQLSLTQPGSTPWTQDYAYDVWLRLNQVTSPAGGFSYEYSGLSDRVQFLRLPNRWGQGNSVIYTEDDDLMRRTITWAYTLQSDWVNGHSYTYDAANQRTQQSFASGRTVDYTYDPIGQLKTAKGSEPDGTTLRLQEQFGYAYDAARNLMRRTNNALVQTFNVDNRNQLTTATRSGTLTVAGVASQIKGDPSTGIQGVTNVTVSGSGLSSGPAAVYSDGSWARSGATLSSGNSIYIANAQDTYGRTSQDNAIVNLPATASFVSDLNGNLRTNNTRTFDYDDENQLIRITEPGAWKSEFTYDGMLRRRIRKEFAWTGSAWSQTNEVRYVYDGMLVVQERDGNNVPQVSYTRGLDLSGSFQGAGGIGGLMARTDNALMTIGDSRANAYYHCDGNGNITALLTTNGTVAARYNYDPYGNLLGMSGPLAEANVYRFSSKEAHPNSGFYYYGFRYYEPNLQRWINRDPLSDIASVSTWSAIIDNAQNGISVENEGSPEGWANVNLNVFRTLANNPLEYYDAFGLEDSSLNACARGKPDEVAKLAKDLVQEGKEAVEKTKRLTQLAKNAKKLDTKELAKRFKVPEKEFHGVKDKILQDFAKDIKNRTSLGNNPDVLIDAEGNIVLRTAKGLLKEAWNTGLNISSYCSP